MRMPARVAAALTVALLLAGSADAQLVDCFGGQRPTQLAELMFGRNTGNRLSVKEADWSRFVDREIMSRFPSGLTMFNAAGQWRDQATGKIKRELSKNGQNRLPRPAEDMTRRNENVTASNRRF